MNEIENNQELTLDPDPQEKTTAATEASEPIADGPQSGNDSDDDGA